MFWVSHWFFGGTFRELKSVKTQLYISEDDAFGLRTNVSNIIFQFEIVRKKRSFNKNIVLEKERNRPIMIGWLSSRVLPQQYL